MTVWLLDSNVVMGYLNQDSTQGFVGQFEQALVGGAAVSVITTIEVLGWRGHDALIKQLATPLGYQKTITKWLVTAGRVLKACCGVWTKFHFPLPLHNRR